ncbi:AH receptor-interacting protein-like [Gigantopelta aegis]|uniref:AH receptor-interacting protein-like n=1 Tax=Gigantopelta aegis TaxID=1735272 RepID=UPI001B88AFFC|nr:AH receptor-interacting protein-like [Gigantopelta aegis]
MADILANLQKEGIHKKIIYPGIGEIPQYLDGTRITFHYQTTKTDEDKTVLDDSRKHSKPMELIVGKKFKLEVWEICLKTMKTKEVSEFLCDTKQTAIYPLVAKSLRKIHSDKPDDHNHEEQHCCGMMALSEHGLGHDDLNELMKKPQPLIFTLDVLKVELPGEFDKEVWTMDEDEKLSQVPVIKQEGNQLYLQKKYTDAAKKYATAIGMLEQLLLKEKPGDEDYVNLEKLKIPLLLNYSQCKLLQSEFYPVIEHTTEVLKLDPDNIKALYRRAKAHVGAWNIEEARADFDRVLELDPKLSSSVKQEMKHLEDILKEKENQEKKSLKGMFS